MTNQDQPPRLGATSDETSNVAKTNSAVAPATPWSRPHVEITGPASCRRPEAKLVSWLHWPQGYTALCVVRPRLTKGDNRTEPSVCNQALKDLL
jgi:hypothetical protein